ncbi:RluA family pseudouridine synthase [Phormidium tenue FACHB-886]|nr:RluA family pseudouridine synthase [Phormidium tenue FACHB-886]
MLHPLSDFIDAASAISVPPAYWYEGDFHGERLRLPRTALAEAIARGLMRQLAGDDRYSREGKMYGVLLVETPAGEQHVLKAFSGLLNGSSCLEGWVPAIPGRSQLALEEARTLAVLDALKQKLIALQHLPVRQHHSALAQEFETCLRQLSQQHQQHQQARQQQRQRFSETLTGEALTTALEQLNDQSRKEGIARRRLKQERDVALLPLKQAIEQADAQIRDLKQQRKTLSQTLQAQLHRVYCLTNFAGESIALQQLSNALPTGTGDCCAPKLLNYAALHRLKPLAMAEFWWGAASTNSGKVRGEFYEACADRCQPLMGFLLSGLQPSPLQKIAPAAEVELPILYEDEWLIAVNKPAGLLSVPGRTSDRQDSVLSRLRQRTLPTLMAAHRLDQETSGILLLVRDLQTYRQLSQQFQQRQVHKGYEALLAGAVTLDCGRIDLPLWADPADRPRQKVDWQRGKPSLTHFQILERAATYTRVSFVPLTGRTHQLRVHAANGLKAPILGDRLYGDRSAVDRLHLHAKELRFQHPQSRKTILLRTKTPF